MGKNFQKKKVNQDFKKKHIQKQQPQGQLSELKIETIKEGDKKTFPVRGKQVTVHYTGRLTNGKKFDSSRDINQPFKFLVGIGEVIKAWDQAVMKMSLGQQAKVTCPSHLAYGKRGVGSDIPPNSDLIFDIELLKC